MIPSAMPGSKRAGLDSGELVVELPLQPAVEVDLVGVLLCERGDTGTVRVPEVLRPVMPVATVHLRERAPDGEIIERTSLAVTERGVGELATG